MLVVDVCNRDYGLLRPRSLENKVYRERSRRLQLSKVKNFDQATADAWSSTNSIDVEAQENRYVLAGYSTGELAIFDLKWHVPHWEPRGALAVVDTNEVLGQRRHARGIACARWYPVDAGLFITASSDTAIHLWDACTLENVSSIKIPNADELHSLDLNCEGIIVTGTSDAHVKLGDISHDTLTHNLGISGSGNGHSSAVTLVKWVSGHDYLLSSGDADGKVRLWDVRSAFGPLCSLDCNDTKDSLKLRQQPRGRPINTNARAHQGSICCIDSTSDASLLMTLGSDNRLRIWDIANPATPLVHDLSVRGNVRKRSRMPSSLQNNLIYCPVERSIFSYGVRGTDAGKQCFNLSGIHNGTVNDIAFVETTEEMVTAGSDGTVKILEPAKWPRASSKAHWRI